MKKVNKEYWYFVEYFENCNIIKSDKNDKEFRKEYPRYTIHGISSSLQMLIRTLQTFLVTHREIRPYHKLFINHIFDKHPEYTL